MAQNSHKFEQMEMKMEAVKKVYAEMILNTTQEAAARVMLAERKSIGFQKELAFLKQDSARLMHRLNHIFTSQIQEAEARSLSQQNKIDELEAQLGEAEGIILDLRDELRQVQDELENMRNQEKRPSYGHITGIDKPVLDCLPQDDELYSLNTSQVLDANALQDCPIEVASLHPIALRKCSNLADDYSLLVGPHSDCIHPDPNYSTSVIVQNREADPRINGCCQKTFDGNFSNMKVSTSNVKDRQSLIDNLSEVRVTKARNKRHNPVTKKSNTKSNLGTSLQEPFSMCPSITDEKYLNKTEDELEGQFPNFSRCKRNQGIRTTRRSGKSARYREAIASLQKKPRKNYLRLPLVSKLKACSSGQRVQSVENPTKVNCCESVSDDLSSKSEIMNSCTDGHPGEEGNSKETRSALIKKRCPVSGNGEEELELIDVPIVKGLTEVHHQAAHTRFFNSTFQRKRRKNTLNKLDENIIPEMDHEKGRLVKPTDVPAVDSNASIKETHGNSGQVMQVCFTGWKA